MIIIIFLETTSDIVFERPRARPVWGVADTPPDLPVPPTQEVSICSEETVVLFEKVTHLPAQEPFPGELGGVGKTVVISSEGRRHGNEGEEKGVGEGEDRIDGGDTENRIMIGGGGREEGGACEVTITKADNTIIPNTVSDATAITSTEPSTSKETSRPTNTDTNTDTDTNADIDTDTAVTEETSTRQSSNSSASVDTITITGRGTKEEEEEIKRDEESKEEIEDAIRIEKSKEEDIIAKKDDNGETRKDTSTTSVKEAWVDDRKEPRPQSEKPHPLTSRENIVRNNENSVNTRTKDRLVISPDGEEGMKKRKELFSKVYQEKEENSNEVRGERGGRRERLREREREEHVLLCLLFLIPIVSCCK